MRCCPDTDIDPNFKSFFQPINGRTKPDPKPMFQYRCVDPKNKLFSLVRNNSRKMSRKMIMLFKCYPINVTSATWYSVPRNRYIAKKVSKIICFRDECVIRDWLQKAPSTISPNQIELKQGPIAHFFQFFASASSFDNSTDCILSECDWIVIEWLLWFLSYNTRLKNH